MSGQMQRFYVRFLIAISFLLLLTSTPVFGRVIYVDDDAKAPGDGKSWATAYRYLQDALADAKTADKPVEVRVAQGIYKPDQGADQMPGDRLASFELISGVTLKGAYAGVGTADPNARDVKAYKTVLSGDLAGNDGEVVDPCDLERNPTRSENSCNVVEIAGASGVRLEGLAITGGHGNIGARERVASTIVGAGARIVSSQGLLVKDCTFLSNYAGHGPGGCAIGDSTNVVIEGSTFARNSGGGLAVGQSSGVTLAECEISDNYSASDAGGMAANGDITVVDCVFSGNMAPPGGGGAVRLFEANARFTRCAFMNNSAKWGGGVGISGIIKGEAYRFDGCRFWNNKAATNGGALSIYSHGNVNLANCILAGNSAENGGAIGGHSFARLSIINCTSAENRAAKGQFIFLHALYPAVLGPANIANCIIVDNDNAVYAEDIGVSLDYSLLRGGPGSIIDPNNKVAWGLGNIMMDPRFADPGYWGSNGTPDDPREDFYVIGDYHSKSQAGRWDPVSQSWVIDDVTSPCIDAGDPSSPIGFEPFPNGGRINMGAYGGTEEASKGYFGKTPCATIIAGDINGDCKVDFRDLAILAMRWLEDRSPHHIVTTIYRLVEDKSSVVSYGGRRVEKHTLAGTFDLTIDFTAGTTTFERVNVTSDQTMSFIDYGKEGEPIYTNELDRMFHMTQLVSTDVNDTEVRFLFQKNIPSHPGADVHVKAVIQQGSISLKGYFGDAMPDGRWHELNAVAVPVRDP